MTPLITDEDDMVSYFTNPAQQRQRQYEAVRAVTIDKLSVEEVCTRFGYKASTVYSLVRDARNGRIELFPKTQKGPQGRRTSSDVQNRIVALRRQSLSTPDIHDRLIKEKIDISARTIERILKDAGFSRLPRRTNSELGRSGTGKNLPERSEMLNFEELKPFNVDCPSAGVFFFLPYILESNILDVVRECALPESSDIGNTHACLSMLLLKLIGCNKLSHIGSYDQEPGLGVFAGLNVLPKPSYMNTYSCRCSESQLMALQQQIISALKKKYPEFYRGDFLNLDFHSIPHYGDESEMEKVWCGARNKTLKGANTVFVQDSNSHAIIYTRADILRKEEANEVKKFVTYWKSINGDVNETLVFDCKFTTYKTLDDIDNENVKFVTLRKRYAALVDTTLALPKESWQKLHIPIPKRKHKNVSVHESEVRLKDCRNKFRQIAIKDHGRSKPTFILTNNWDLPLVDVLKVYAHRWRVENKFAELVSFFNLNALSSPVMTRIHFDILWTIIADTLYHRFAKDLRRFEKSLAPQLFRKFIDMPGKVVYDGNKFQVKIRKRAHTPVLMGVHKLQQPFTVPWLDGKSLEIVWTA